jgi:dTDP-4-amino-4,6-dideoxygalactose transaminase
MDDRLTIPIARPLLGEHEAEAAARVVRSGWVMQGPEVLAFEREFAAFVGAEHACAVSSGTAALHLALLAVGVGPGDEVVTASHSFVATANSIRLCGGVPVLADVEPGTLNLDIKRVEEALTPRTRAILCVHQLGMPCDLHALAALAARHNIHLVEDAACAAGSEIAWRGAWEPIGRPRGSVACFSFHPRKVITTGDGGMITTNNEAWDHDCRLRRQHGIAVADAPVAVAGMNYRLTDIQAAVGREQLKRLPSLVAIRRALAARYRQRLDGHGLELPVEPAWARSNWQSFCLLLPDGVDETRVARAMAQAGIATRPGIANAHQQPIYAALQHGPLPVSERAAAQGLKQPLYPGKTAAEVDRVCEALLTDLNRRRPADM